jgi:hypothetical protein
MRFSTLFSVGTLLALSSGQAASDTSGDGQDIISALQLVQSHLQYLDSLVLGFQGDPATGLSQALVIQDETHQLGDTMEYATNVADASPPLDDQASLQVGLTVLTLKPDVEKTLKDIRAAKPKFDGVFLGLFSISNKVKETLENQKELAAAMGYSIAEKLSGAAKEQAPDVINDFSDQFTLAIAAYADSVGPARKL